MNHGLRTPLNGVLGYAQLLQRDPAITPKQQEGLRIIEHCGTQLFTLISDILDLAKVEVDNFDLASGILDCPELLDNLSNHLTSLDASVVNTGPEISLIGLPVEVVETLYDLVRKGNLKGVIAEANRLEQLDSQYLPLATHLRQLAKTFQDQELLQANQPISTAMTLLHGDRSPDWAPQT